MKLIFVKISLCIMCLSQVKIQDVVGDDFGDESNNEESSDRCSSLETEDYYDQRDNNKSSSCGPQVLSCEDSIYRTFDGTCNNLKYPNLGAVNTTFARLVPPKYADGISEPPVSVSGKPLPNPRNLSNYLFDGIDIEDTRYSLLAMQWGQIITHDMTFAAGTLPATVRASKCCTPDKKEVLPKEEQDPRCMPIEISPTDLVYGPVEQLCHNFIRTITDTWEGCAEPNKPTKQIVGVTHYMDLSIIYGSSRESSNWLREFDGGRLKVDVRNGRSFAPEAPDVDELCNPINETRPCYITGDARVNQDPQLTVLHILWIRTHNKIGSYLSELNPHWDDEKLFQETRRLLIALHQHISYYEWLPIFLGEETARKHGLLYKTDGYTHDYNEVVDPSSINEHATAAFRFLHTNIAGHLMLANTSYISDGELRLSDHFERPMVIEKNDNFDGLVRGMCTQYIERSDTHFTSEIRNFMFRDKDIIGQDLVAMDIQRGRDHGVASYNEMRKYCGLPSVEKFEDFSDSMFLPDAMKLADLYEDPEDIDFVVGGSVENLANDAQFGPTYLCVVIEQFYRTRAGDRFFFENGDSPYPFTDKQLREIRKASISRLLCDNADNITSIQPKGFQSISALNPVVSCLNEDLIPKINFEAWKEN